MSDTVVAAPVRTRRLSPIRLRHPDPLPNCSTRFEDEPGYCESAALWLYGNVKLFESELAHVPDALGSGFLSNSDLDRLEREAENLVLERKVLVCGVPNGKHQRAAIVPLRWGAPRVLVFSGGFGWHLGEGLRQEPFRAARLWRYEFDPKTDLVVSRRAPDRKPTFASFNPTVDRLIAGIATRTWPGLALPDRS